MMKTDSLKNSVGSVIATVLLIIGTISVTVIAIASGHKLVASQYVDPVLGEGLWPFLIFGVTATITLLTVFSTMVLLGFVSEIGQAGGHKWNEYTVIGISGLGGIVVALTLVIGTQAEISSLIQTESHTGQLIGLVSIAALLSIVYVHYLRPTTGTTQRKVRNKSEISPEFAKDEIPSAKETRKIKERENRDERTNEDDSLGPSWSVNTNNTDSRDAGDDEQPNPMEDTEYQWVTETDVSFEDIGGMEDLKQELLEDVLLPLKRFPDRADELGVSAPNIVFHGPPGTGKTYMAKALATELGLPFAKLSGSNIQSKWINESADKVNALFEEAKTIAQSEGGAVVFLDELDSVLKERSGSSNTHEEDMKVVNEFLNHLEDTDEYNIVFIGATNRLDALDEAGIRSGRIDKKIEIGKPDTEARYAILKAQLRKRPNDITNEELSHVAEQTEGVVASDLELLIKEAAKDVLVKGQEKITQENIDTSIEKLDTKTS